MTSGVRNACFKSDVAIFHSRFLTTSHAIRRPFTGYRTYFSNVGTAAAKPASNASNSPVPAKRTVSRE